MKSIFSLLFVTMQVNYSFAESAQIKNLSKILATEVGKFNITDISDRDIQPLSFCGDLQSFIDIGVLTCKQQ